MTNLLTPTKIVKSKRKSLSLIINNKGELIVRAPLNYKDNLIFDFINKKANWIISKRTKAMQEIYQPLKLINGERISLLGKTYKIALFEGKSVKIVEDRLLIPSINSNHKLVLFLKKSLKAIIEEMLIEITEHYAFKYKSVSISSAKTNWGSCSFDNRLHFTYKLMMCPKSVIEYIVIHELVHTIIKNHSTDFWRNVKKLYPNYKTCEKWLKENKGIVEII